jgi:hypothetical protein
MSVHGRAEPPRQCGPSSHRTRRWSKADSNRWSHLRVSTTAATGLMSPTASIRVGLVIPLANSISISVASGTSSSNPLSSSGESLTNRSARRVATAPSGVGVATIQSGQSYQGAENCQPLYAPSPVRSMPSDVVKASRRAFERAWAGLGLGRCLLLCRLRRIRQRPHFDQRRNARVPRLEAAFRVRSQTGTRDRRAPSR